MLLNQPDLTTINTITNTTNNTCTHSTEDYKSHLLHQDQHLNHNLNVTSALFAAAQHGHTECVKLLLSSGSSFSDVSDENGFTPLHSAAAHGHSSCVEELLAAGAPVDPVALGGQTPLFLACEAGSCDVVRVLLSAGADRSCSTADGCTALHAAVRSGHVETLRLLLWHETKDDPPLTPGLPPPLTPGLPPPLLNRSNNDGWTAAHTAAALGLKECLEVLCSHSEQDIQRKDKCNRTIHDVATDDCKDLLENLHSYRVLVCLQSSGGVAAAACCGGVEELKAACCGGVEELKAACCGGVEELKAACCGGVEELKAACCPGGPDSQVELGRVTVQRNTSWSEFGSSISRTFTSYLQSVCGAPPTGREDAAPRSPLGLSPASIASILIGDVAWSPGQDPPLAPWDLVRKPLSQSISVRLKGLPESCLDELALENLFPLPLLHNYVRLVEQYGNLIFLGLEGSCQEHFANVVAHCIKWKQEAVGLGCDVVRVEVEENLSKEQLLDAFISCGFLVPVGGSEVGVGGPPSVVVLLEGLEKAASLTGLLGDLCTSLEERRSAAPLVLSTGPHLFLDNSFLIGTLSKPRLQGAELRLQQHFRWVTMRWDQEPLHGMLGRHLRRKLLQKVSADAWSPDGVLERSVAWVTHVWQQLNTCLTRLGTHDALLGPQHFLSCPVTQGNAQAVVRWLSRLWNAVVVPRVEDAVVSRVTARRPPPSSSPSSPSHRPSPSNCGLSAGQAAVVKAALSILVNKAVVPGCPLPRHEMERYLLEFRGGAFPLTAISSYRGGGGGGGGRKGRDGGKLRRSNTSPRKKGGPALSWSSGSFREGSVSSSDVSFISSVQREPVGLSVFSDDETDLIRELQTMCSSKSEPDISKISRAKDDLILFSPTEATSVCTTTSQEQETGVQQRAQASLQSVRGSSHAAVQSSERRSGPRAKSQLPVPSSRGQQTRAPLTAAAAAASSSNNNNSSSSIRNQTPPGRRRSTTNNSSRTKQPPPATGNNNYRNHINDNNQSHEEIWILHRDLHENNNNK